MSKTEGQIQSDISTDESRAEWGAWFVVFGLLLEVTLATANSLGYGNVHVENWGAVLADSLVAIGVIIEIRFGRRANEGHAELRTRANTRAATFEREAAELRKRAVDLEQITAWRKISAEEKGRMVELLKPGASNMRVFFEYQNGDMEAFMHATEIAKIFISAGAKISGHTPNLWMQASYGLSISVSPDVVRSSVLDAFMIPKSTATFEKQWEPMKMWPIPTTEPRPNVLVAVYPKPPPLFMLEANADDTQNT